MDQTNIIRDLLHWMDNNLDRPLSLDNVAAKAGYSKWHLQRMFKDVTGQAIGSYIRARRLSKAAVALRLTSRPILDIALQYRFDSQQTFTRAFKKQFNRTPASYRRNEEWCATGICPPIMLDNKPLPAHKYVTLEDQLLIGTEHTCSYTLEQWSSACTEMRHGFWVNYLQHAETLPPRLYGLHHSDLSAEHEDEQTVFYTTAIEPEYATFNTQDNRPVVLPGGDYISFSYFGGKEQLKEFLFTVYGICLPKLNITRRKGYDVERYYLTNLEWKNFEDESQTHVVEFEYLIPIER
ncbi:transcriptional activator for resistance to antibiotics, organic solvents and heavy metals (AraC/XylS family) (right origin-binding protein) [Xenorhabdus bovienii str. Jollieti]|uniref:Transcriptional activator for resistance to antibiotics, organic solvents and heavy metals (AraC/XylS family) (Right origin-binding protein) n=1 Tax=Xenorhabdus bovienii (strain SS-2004) TaxID=406818 RepID=D3V4Q9_XENBS|nr:MDR efflux pump AcrAB transcriptional activator RobA [Xenorhabdus bovienii]CBJ82638.1 transcriptional activator for resistance to antibiotics, organic solvents and heavy metals (AraC/XylS family) (right origin-binding protein) [Xenorhabdus bovienii SS-2004]CDH28434.1 transcriptional activator for resistance to antibiotics, organic solvents and heavy metals (AraC/XylS family) (right origin-binding protein) [Xenorhabdus bovienii str. Jollieti]